MRVKVDWALLMEDGTVSALLDTFADSEAELARYMEYLLSEKKWTTAQNVSSLTSLTDLIARKTHRKKSSSGYVVVSHTDPQGSNRLANYGKTFFNLDDRSNYDNIAKDADPQDAFRMQTLVPWSHSSSYVIPRGTRFLSANGKEFLATETIATRALQMPYDAILADDVQYQDFIAAGGWNGIKYLKVPVIQGVQKSYTFGLAVGSRFETFKLPITNCEDASNNVSKGFLHFYVNTTPSVISNREEWVQTTNVILAGPYDKVYEVINLPNFEGVLFKVGDGITGKTIPAGATVTLEYLETEGVAGNIEKKYQITSIIFPDGNNPTDPRTGSLSSFVSVINTNPLFGGSDEETEEDLRVNAPQEYLKYYAVATTAAYEQQIKMYSQIGLNKVKVFPGSSGGVITVSENIVAATSQDVLYVTAITANGEMLEDPENQFTIPITKALGDLKAPSDIITYVDPNFIRIRLNTIVHSDANEIADEEVKAIEKQALIDKYSVFNMDFKEPFHNSEFVSLTQSFPFVNYVTAFPEAVADTYMTTDGVRQILGTTDYPTLYGIKFKFDSMFGQNLYAQGFKNYTLGAQYLLRVDLKIKNDPVKASIKNRTFFLYDERSSYSGETIPQTSDAEDMNNDGRYLSLSGKPVARNSATLTNWVRPSEMIEPTRVVVDGNPILAYDRAVRVAQYPLITNITDDKMMLSQVKIFSKAPYEIRPVVVDTYGMNKVFAIADVPLSERLLLGSSSASVQCYRYDTRYIDYFDISFTENYDNPDSPDFGLGEIIIPASYFEFTNIDIDIKDQFLSALQNYVSIKVYAHPASEDFEPSGWNEIIFTENEDIVVERVRT